MGDRAWVEYGKTWDEFTAAGLALPGTLVDVRPGPHPARRLGGPGCYLIGDVNELRGVCDDCTAFDGRDVVTRYAVLLGKDW